ncbi:MAG: hypothetical protein ABIJ21_04660 [Nanoarchaeota archaeon]
MKRLFLLVLFLLIPIAGAVEHPFTLFTSNQIPALAAKMTDGLGPDDAAKVQAIQYADNRLGSQESTLFHVNAINSMTPIYVQEQAFAYWFGDPARKSLYRDKCKAMAMYLTDNFHPDNSYTNNYPEQDNPWILFALATAYDNCFVEDAPNDPQKAAVRGEIEAYLNYALTEPWPHDWRIQIEDYANGNWHANIGGSILMGALAVKDDGQNTQLYEDAHALGRLAIEGYIQHTLDSDGGCYEGVGYCALSMLGLTYGAIAQKNYDGVDYFSDPRVEKFLTYLAYNAIPEGNRRFHNWNDWPTYSTGVIRNWHIFPTYAMTRFPTPLSRWVHEYYVGSSPQSMPFLAIFGDDLPSEDIATLLPDSMLFSGIGQYFYKNGWQFGTMSKDIQFTFFSGIFHMGHNQEDKNTFTLLGYKDRLIVDTGDSKDAGACGDPASMLEGHNLIMVNPSGDYYDANNNGQMDAGEGLWYLGMAKSSGNCGTDGYIRNSFISNAADFLHGDAREAYIKNNDQFNPFPDWSWCAHPYNGGTSTTLECIHLRSMDRANRYMLIVKPDGVIPPYFVLADDTRTSANPLDQYKFLLHTEYKDSGTPLHRNSWTHSTNPLRVTGEHGGFLDVFWISPTFSPALFTDARYNTQLESPYANQDGFNQRLEATITSGNPQWFMVFFPYDAQVIPPQYSTLPLTQGFGAKMTFATATDYVLYAPTNVISGQGISANLKMGMLREIDGLPERYAFASTTGFTKDGLAVVEVTGIPASVSSDGLTVEVGVLANTYHVYGPDLTQAIGEKIPVPLYKAGDFALVTPAPPPLCADQGGNVCTEGQECVGEWEFSQDTNLCCIGMCEGNCPEVPPDVNCDYLIDDGELLYMINQWLQGLSPIEQLISVMEWWKASQII